MKRVHPQSTLSLRKLKYRVPLKNCGIRCGSKSGSLPLRELCTRRILKLQPSSVLVVPRMRALAVPPVMRLSVHFLHLVTGLACPTLARASLVVHQGRSTITPGWSLHRRADLSAMIPLKIALVQSNLDNLDAYLLDIADPGSSNYGKYWTREAIVEAFRPSSKSVETVHSWLVDDHGIDAARIRLGMNGGAFHLDVTVAEAEDILAAEYHVFRHGNGSEWVGIHGSYHLPEHISKYVDLVWPTVHFDGTPLRWRRNGLAPIPVPTSDNRVRITYMRRESGHGASLTFVLVPGDGPRQQ